MEKQQQLPININDRVIYTDTITDNEYGGRVTAMSYAPSVVMARLDISKKKEIPVQLSSLRRDANFQRGERVLVNMERFGGSGTALGTVHGCGGTCVTGFKYTMDLDDAAAKAVYFAWAEDKEFAERTMLEEQLTAVQRYVVTGTLDGRGVRYEFEAPDAGYAAELAVKEAADFELAVVLQFNGAYTAY